VCRLNSVSRCYVSHCCEMCAAGGGGGVGNEVDVHVILFKSYQCYTCADTLFGIQAR
jgi:hypothetical protein